MSEILKVAVSSQSPIKLEAVRRAFVRVGEPVEVEGYEVDSGVAAQPRSIEETVEGAKNRHEALRKLVGDQIAAYFVTSESGVVKPFSGSAWKGCEVVIIERVSDGLVKFGIDLGVEYPDEMMATIPDEYPDLGILLQKEYSYSEKDPPAYLTNGKLARVDLIEMALFKVLAQISRKNDENRD